MCKLWLSSLLNSEKWEGIYIERVCGCTTKSEKISSPAYVLRTINWKITMYFSALYFFQFMITLWNCRHIEVMKEVAEIICMICKYSFYSKYAWFCWMKVMHLCEISLTFKDVASHAFLQNCFCDVIPLWGLQLHENDICTKENDIFYPQCDLSCIYLGQVHVMS